MATKAESSVKLTADDKTKAGFDSAAKNADKLKNKIKNLGDVTGVALGLAAYNAVVKLGGAIKSLIGDTVNLVDRIGKLSDSTKLGTESLSAMRQAAKFSGVEWERMVVSFQDFQKNMGEALRGSSDMVINMKMLGINIKEYMKLKPDEQFKVMAEALSRIEDPVERAVVGMKTMGEGYQSVFRTFKDGAESMDQFIQQAKDAGTLLSEETVADVEEMKDTVQEMTDKWEAFKLSMLSSVAPGVTSALDTIMNKFKEFSAWQEEAHIETQISALESQMIGARHRGDKAEDQRLRAELRKWKDKRRKLDILRAGPAPQAPTPAYSSPALGASQDTATAMATADPVLGDQAGHYKDINYGKWLEKQRQEMEKLRQEQGRMADEEERKAKEWSDSIRKLRTPVKELKGEFDELKLAVEGWGRSFADRLMEGELNFKKFITAAVQEIARFYIAQASTKAAGGLFNLFTGVLGGLFGGGGGNALATAGTTAVSAQTGGAKQFFQNFSTGINRVPNDMLANLHAGERIVSASGGHRGVGGMGGGMQGGKAFNPTINFNMTQNGQFDQQTASVFGRNLPGFTRDIFYELRRQRLI